MHAVAYAYYYVIYCQYINKPALVFENWSSLNNIFRRDNSDFLIRLHIRDLS